MGSINAIAHLNPLTKSVGEDYYLTAQVTGTLYLTDIIERLKKREIATKNVDGAAFVQTFLDECAAATAEGYNVITSFFRSEIGIQGTLYAADLGHPIPSDRVKLSVNLMQGDGAKAALQDATVYAFEQAAATGPIVQSVFDPTENVANHLNPGGMVLIKGMRLSVKGEDASVGILFTNVDDSSTTVIVPAAKIYPNMPSKLQFALPAEVTAGDWNVTITTQSTGSSSQLTKQPRSFVYPAVVSVGIPSEPEEDEPVVQ